MAAELGQNLRIGSRAGRSNCFAHGPQKPNRAFRDNHVHGGILKFHPKKSVGGQRRHRIDTAAERGPEMVRIQRDRRFNCEAAVIMRDDSQPHRASNWNLLVEELFGFKNRPFDAQAASKDCRCL